MKTTPLKLVTIVCEPVLTETLIGELKQLGSTGFTLTSVRGEGSRQMNSSEVPGEKNKLECIVSEEVSRNIIDHIARNYFPSYSVIAYITETLVVRGDKYV